MEYGKQYLILALSLILNQKTDYNYCPQTSDCPKDVLTKKIKANKIITTLI